MIRPSPALRFLWWVVPFFLLTGCAEPLPDLLGLSNEFDNDRYLSADAVRGGLLYDQWWQVQGTQPPSGDHPLWSRQNTNPRRGPDTWRCKECHGWDYRGADGAYGPGSSHFTAFPSLVEAARTRTPEELYRFFVASNNNRHGYGNRLSIGDIYDLIRFIKGGDLTGIPGRPTDGLFDQGNASQGREVYQTQCQNCHGSDGTGMFSPSNDETVGPLARENPAEFMHKVRFGQPGSVMVRGTAYDRSLSLSLMDATDLLAFARTLQPGTSTGNGGGAGDFDLNRYNNADEAYGGRLYDQWWTAQGLSNIPVAGDHPLWSRQSSNTRSGGDTWRCKECHGWDYRGADGAYGPDSSHYTGFPGILTPSSPQRDEPGEIFDFLANDPDHAYPQGVLSEDDLYALTRFIMARRKEDDPSKYIDDATAQVIGGNFDFGRRLYEGGTAACANSGCHGIDGRAIDFADGDPGTSPNEFLDTIAKENPWEFLHKARFGQPGSPMPALLNQPDYRFEQALNLLKYAQTWLAPDPKRGGRLFDHWMDERALTLQDRPRSYQPKLRDGLDPATGDAISQETSWRCKTCHGWDYQGRGTMPGLQGVITLSEADIAAKIASGGRNHSFGHPIQLGLNRTPGLTDTDIADLTRFLSSEVAGQDVGLAMAQGDASRGADLYNGNRPGGACAACHGASDPVLAQIAADLPAEFVHKARFGQPASVMSPGNRGFQGLKLNQAADVLAFVQSWGSGGGGSGFAQADLVRGGRLFDKWWAEAGLPAPTSANPFWSLRDASIPDLPSGKEADSWRCKTCHGWDYRGIGFYRTPTGRVVSKDDLVALPGRYSGILSSTELQRHVFDWIRGKKSPRHDFSAMGLSDQDVWDLVKFILAGGVLDTTFYYSPVIGDIVVPELPDVQQAIDNGRALYQGEKDPSVDCSACHGLDGNAQPPGGTQAVDIFRVAGEEPEEFFHKVRFGQPGTGMIAIYGAHAQDLGDKLSLNREARDILGYARSRFGNRP